MKISHFVFYKFPPKLRKNCHLYNSQNLPNQELTKFSIYFSLPLCISINFIISTRTILSFLIILQFAAIVNETIFYYIFQMVKDFYMFVSRHFDELISSINLSVHSFRFSQQMVSVNNKGYFPFPLSPSNVYTCILSYLTRTSRNMLMSNNDTDSTALCVTSLRMFKSSLSMMLIIGFLS